ncbi:MAG: DNA polymerase I [Agathobacter sp.]|nr:DNA polymerase I [Agathobacter sp.]
MSEKLVLIDGHSILNRAFFGLPDLTNSQGIHTNAVYGFLNIMFKILEEEKPDYLTVAFDVHAPTFRHKMFDAYKGTRKPMADELKQQVPIIKEMLTAMGIKIVEMEGYEADDILGTLAFKAESLGMEVAIISGDRDLLQLATEHIMIRIPKTKRTGTEIENYLAKDVIEKYNVTPKEFIDVKALQGDTADNIPGVPGIGEKTAGALIAQYHSIEAVHEDAANVKPPRAAKNIVEFWDQAVMSKVLATINTEVPVDYEFSDAKIMGNESLYTEEAFVLCKQLEFKNLLNRFNVSAPKNNAEEFFKIVDKKSETEKIFDKVNSKDVAISVIPEDVSQEEEGKQLSLFDLDDGTSTNEIAALCVAFSDEDIYFIKTGKEISSEYLINKIIELKASQIICPDLKKILHELKIFRNCISDVRDKFFDMTIASYLLNPLLGEYPYENIAKDYLGMLIPSKKELLGKTSAAQMLREDESVVVKYACFETYVAWKSKAVLEEKLKEQGMLSLFREIEMPLVFVLYDMEEEGISIDGNSLKEYGDKLSVSINELESRIYEQAGEKFNINSPKQLGVILFEKLELPNGKKTKTGYSTSAEVLEGLAEDYPIVSDILEYRQLSKLKSTYADGLANYIDHDGLIHTTFNQTITATGRLSSTEPNLQNIPIRIELGKLIRKVFHPKKGNLFIDSDYSQIELRVLAHMSGDEKLINAFKNNQDVHRTTAAEVFHVPFDEVTPLQRRNAKAVNFGIVYGISAFGLAKDLGIGRKEAQDYIDSYFETYPKIKAFLDKTVADAREKGYIVTLFGRIRPIPELSSGNFMQRQFGERVAMNSPIQGTAADIIKIAMINVHDRLIRESYKSRLILQVHDELLIETGEEEKDAVVKLLEEEMQQALDMSVGLDVDTAFGYDWYEAH